jgi:hypothetical protein
MNDKAISNVTETDVMESVVIGGDLSRLSSEQRVHYYKAVCDSLKLNPLTRPFDYITLNGKLTLYARKDAADQLRKINNISIEKPEITFEDDWIIVSVAGSDATGRKDSDVGVVNKKDMRGDFGNALMKAVTKAKRRLTLSICGLGMLDETEVETIPTARVTPIDVETGEVLGNNGHERISTKQAVAELGFDVPEPPEPPALGNPYKKFNVTVEQAKKIVGSDGVKYGDVDDKDLRGKRIGIVRKLNIKNISAEEKDELMFKVEAIDVLLSEFVKAQ